MENYTVLSRIGDGAEGVVFSVEHRQTRRKFAMKVVRCADQSRVNSALKEVKVLLRLHHPHIVSYVDFFLVFYNQTVRQEFAAANGHGAQLFEDMESSQEISEIAHGVGPNVFCTSPSEVCVCLVMELCTCGDLRCMIQAARQQFMESGSHPISEAQILLWMKQCTLALAFIHEQGFFHRDLKPTNIFFDDNKNIKIGDFGLAATVGLGRHSAVGTPLYLAPERMLCQVYDAKVDVWGLGVVMLELVTLREQPINSQILENPLAVETVMQQVMAMGFTRQFAALLRDMLQRFPEDRPSPAAILDRLSAMTTAPLSPAVQPCGEGACVCPRHLSCRHQEHRQLDPQRRCVQVTRVHMLNDVDLNIPPLEKYKAKNCVGGQTLSRYGLPLFHLSGNSLCDVENTTVRVPQDYPTITLALNALCSMPHVRNIVVARNTIHNTSFTLLSSLPDNVRLVGETPAPVIEVDEASCAIHCASGRGTVENFIIRHSGRRDLQFDQPKDEKSHDKPFRPCAISITGGEWKITRCSISCSNGSGVSVASETEAVVSHCMICDVKIAGIVLMEGGRGLFEENTFTNCEFAAFWAKRNSSVRLLGNQVRKGAQTGMFFHDSLGLVEGNVISSNGGCGVVAKGPEVDIIFRGNRVVRNKQAGFFCCDGAAPIILENEIQQNRRAGVLVKTHASPRITKNVISCGNGAGIYVSDGGNGFIEENRLEDNCNAGILVTSNGSPHVVKNIIHGNIYEGVWVCKGGGGTFFGNDLRGNQRGPKDIERGSLVVWVGNRES